jgi:hypothetical protein
MRKMGHPPGTVASGLQRLGQTGQTVSNGAGDAGGMATGIKAVRVVPELA